VRKSVRKKSKRFSLSVNRDFDAVIRGCHEQHGSSCWLVPPLVKSFRELHQAGSTDAMLVTEGTKCPVRIYSIEVWNEENKLVGGELGYTVGSIYTSLTGFCSQDGAGSVQLAALGRLLCETGFTLWDLGMDMEYKQDLGSQLMLRSEFVQEVKRVRVANGHVVLPAGQDPVNCKTIIDRAQQAPANGPARSTAFVHPETRPTALIHPVHSSPTLEDEGSQHKKARASPKDC
jgi:Leu/Phe-tRNA-protein transferase